MIQRNKQLLTALIIVQFISSVARLDIQRMSAVFARLVNSRLHLELILLSSLYN